MVVRQPVTAGGVGLLSAFLAPFALLLLAVSLILLPVAAILAIAIMALGAFGWIALGYEVGRRFTLAIHQEWNPSFTAGLGTFALTLVSAMLTSVPVLNCIGWLVPFLLGLAAFGAVIMTRFGTRELAVAGEATAIAPAEPPAGEAVK
jgi:hypothetical protein